MVMFLKYSQLSELFFSHVVNFFCFWCFWKISSSMELKLLESFSTSYHCCLTYEDGVRVVSLSWHLIRGEWMKFCNSLLVQRHKILILLLHLDWGGLEANVPGRLRVSKLWSVQIAQDFISISPLSDLCGIS